MARNPFAGFKDPIRRPRFILWTLAAVFGLVAFVIVALGVTSSYWFCAEVCHKVQDDTITAYNNSSHNKVNCMACHMPANADPVTFMLHKVTALGELYLTATGKYEIPLNNGSHLSMDGDHMPSTQCTQCHSANRIPTPTQGVLIDHDVHEENNIHCSVCHNRIAHNEEGITFVNVDPASGKLNAGHDDFMEMRACMRCHTQEPDAIAPGACEACHPADFDLKPANHTQPGFYELGGESSGHAGLAVEASAEASVTTTGHEAEEGAETDDAHAEEEHEGDAAHEGIDLHAIPDIGEVNYCATCHATQFCTDCHGLVMPHPAGFQDDHGELGNDSPEVCANCHAKGGAGMSGTEFCNSCHHPDGDPTTPWVPQHFDIVRQLGADSCFDCHNPTYCAECHVSGITP